VLDVIDTPIDYIPDDTVGALTHYILNVILFRHVERDLAGSALWRCAGRRHDCEWKDGLVARKLARERERERDQKEGASWTGCS
jgi:hypothetical protein